MKILKKFVLAAVVFCFGVSSIYAKGIFITPGARAAGYGTAFTAIADDLTALYFNPAGLGLQKNTQLMASCFYINYPATSNKPQDFSGGYGVASDKYSTNAVVPFLGFSTPVYRDLILGLGVYAIGGGGGKVENLPVGKIEGQQSFMVYNVSLAKQISDEVSLGIGFDAIQMTDKMVVNFGYPVIDYNRSAFGFQGNIGVIYKPAEIEKLSTGLTLRTGTDIGLPEEKSPAAPLLGIKDSYSYPLTMDIGAAYDIIDEVTVAATLSYNKYSWNGIAYKDTVQVKVGSEYRATDKLSLHLGFFTDPSIVDGNHYEKYSLTNLDMYDMYYACIGAQYGFTDAFKLGFSYSHSFTPTVTYKGMEYEYDVDLFRLDISYKFL